ncbi:MAG: hypothetical protein PHX53_01255, partial [Syntrophales bacterium]|nr:hypothetical protein [Syntrophales bacterium]
MPETMPPRLLIKMPPPKTRRPESQPLCLGDHTFRLRPLCPNEEMGRKPGAAAAPRWYLAEAGPGAATAAELWEAAYKALTAKGTAAAAPGVYIEPDLLHPWLYDNPVRVGGPRAAPGDTCVVNSPAPDLPHRPGFAWHLRDDFSQLKQAREQVAALGPAEVRLAIMDVGFDFSHGAHPERLLTGLQRNFVDDGQPADDASDPYERGPFRNPGHGTATIGILAGGVLKDMVGEANTHDYLGGAPLAAIIPVRIATSVILLRTS